jgi:hypothetical protein
VIPPLAAPAPAPAPAAAERAVALLRRLGAEDIPHPGGTLLAHLQRVHARLAKWQARPALQLAGLCHAFYGTDGFPTALLPLDRRTELAAVIGSEAEAIVYLYASCDRESTYPVLAAADSVLHDRFTRHAHATERRMRQDFAELSAANELDLACADPAFREEWGPELLALFTRLQGLLSADAWSDCRTVFTAEPRCRGRKQLGAVP